MIGLAKEAGFINPSTVATKAIERFARLIIDECGQLNLKESYELSGVIADAENFEFDDVCLGTVKRVERYLSDTSLYEHFGIEE